MVINLITFASILHKQASVRSSHEVILTELEKYFTVNFIDYKDIDKLSPDDFSIIFIATGGVERLVIQHFESLPRPAILLADGMQNSLAAALEISSWLRGRGMKSEILHGELPETIKRIFVLHSNFVAQRSLFGMRIGVNELSKRKKENKLILANQPSDFKQFICLGSTARIKSIETFNSALKRVSIAPSLPVVRMGDLRYMFAQFLVNQDFSMEAISAILGHTKLSTTLNFCSMFLNEEPKIGTVIGDSLDPFLRTRIPGYKGAY